jgi:hypothetical protein
MHIKFFQSLFFFLILFFHFEIFAETVILLHEEVIRGKVNSQDSQTLKMTDETGKERIFPKTEILKVIYRDVTDKKELDQIIKDEKQKKGIKTVKKEEPRKKIQILWRSALIPGWGQWKAGKKPIAVATFLILLGSAGYAASEVRSFNAKSDNYANNSTIVTGVLFLNPNLANVDPFTKVLTSALINKSSFSEVQATQNTANNGLTVLGALYGLQLIHSFFIATKWEKEGIVTPSGKTISEGLNFNITPKIISNYGQMTRDNYYEASYTFAY